MNLNLTPSELETKSYSNLERFLVRLYEEGASEELIEKIEGAILGFGEFFVENPEQLKFELENTSQREEPKNLIRVDFSA